jgi:adenylosuccinate lyase
MAGPQPAPQPQPQQALQVVTNSITGIRGNFTEIGEELAEIRQELPNLLGMNQQQQQQQQQQQVINQLQEQLAGVDQRVQNM